MTNVAFDSKIDAKVIKFLRNSLEVLGLAIREPVDVFGLPNLNVLTDPCRRPCPQPFRPSSIDNLPLKTTGWPFGATGATTDYQVRPRFWIAKISSTND